MRGPVLAAGLCLAALQIPAAAFAAEPAAPSSSDVVDAERLSLARSIVAFGYPEARREPMFFAAMDQMVQQIQKATEKALPVDDPGARAIVDNWTARYIAGSKSVLRKHIPSLMDGIAASYAAMFTADELRDILAFVSTPSGQRFFELSPALMAEPNFAQANQAYMNEVMAKLPAAQAELVQELKDYFAAKPRARKQSAS